MLKGKRKWDILSLFSTKGGWKKVIISQRFKIHSERAMQVCFIISFRPKLCKPITKVMPLSTLFGYTSAQRMKIFIILLTVDNSQWACRRSTKTHIWRWINTDDNMSWMNWISLDWALWPVTFRHSAVTPLIKGRSWLCLCSLTVTEMFKLCFRSLLYVTNHKPVSWGMAMSTVLRSGLWGNLM